MKTKLLKSLLIIVFGAASFVMHAQTTSYDINPTDDGIISDVSNIDGTNPSPYTAGNVIDGTNILKVGASGSGGGGFTTNAIIPFQLPVRPSGKLVVAANLKVNIAYMRHWISSDVDLYGLPYSSTSTMSSTDFYDGTYADPAGTVTGIQDAYIVRDVGGTEPTGVEIFTDRLVDSDTSGDAALVAYINAQYDAGAVAGDYVFLRLSVDATAGSVGAHYYGISDESTAEAPELMLEIEDADVSASADYTVQAPTEDGYVVDAGLTTTNPNPYLWVQAKLGSSDMDGNANLTSVIIPFQLPAKPSGESVDFANLNVYVSFGRQWLNSNADLYGLPFQEAVADGGTGREIFATDHFEGAYPDVTAGVTPIEDDYFTKNVVLGNLDTARWEETTNEANLIAYLNAQYDAGAVEGDWVFLRLSMDNAAMTGSQYFNIEGGDSAFPATLEIGFSGVLSVDSYDKQSLSLYPNPVTDGRLSVSLEGFSNEANLQVYSLLGKLVHSESVDSNNDRVDVELNLTQGIYIVKLDDGIKVKSQKLIVQ